MMDATPDSFQAEVPTSEVQDEFASGPQNRIRSTALRLAGWLFGSPYFPTGPVWLLMALIASNIAVQLLPQPVSYWVDPSVSSYHTFLGTPFRWGLWNLGVVLGYMILVGLILSIISAKPAFALWIGLCIYHLVSFTEAFRCGLELYSPENAQTCGTVHTMAIAVAGILWGFLVLVSARLGLIPLNPFGSSETTPAPAWIKNLSRISVAWILLCMLAVVGTAAFAPRPMWRTIQAAHSPTGRTDAALAYDTKRSVAVLFGGTSKWTPTGGWESLNDTWEWDGENWTQQQPERTPLPRYAAGMAFDKNQGVTVLFGGTGQNSSHQNIYFDDTWQWDGKDWQEIFPSSSPPARMDPSMYFDPLRGAVVIYGGYSVDPDTQTGIFLDDAWEWNGETWQQLAFDEPRRNSASAIIYDPIRQLPMLMDAEGLWAWQESYWTQPGFPASPPGRWGSQMVYNPDVENIVLFGGAKDKDIFDDTWIYNGQSWQQVITKARPPRRSGHTMFYDQRRGRVVLFGGLEGGTFYNDMWELVQP